jgi:predicted nucleic acid-binding protein
MALGLSVTGTLGLLLEAKKRGHINAVSPALNAIVAAGLYISRHHLDAIREKAGEM